MKKHMKNAYEVNLMDELTLKGITQYYAFVQVSFFLFNVFDKFKIFLENNRRSKKSTVSILYSQSFK